MLVEFGQPTKITLKSELVWWLKKGMKWVEHWLPHLVVGSNYVSTNNPKLGEKPYKLDDWSPTNAEDTASLLLYYGCEEIDKSLPMMARVVYPRCVALSPNSQLGVYQLFPFHYYFVLPEPIPPIDHLLSSFSSREDNLSQILLGEIFKVRPSTFSKPKIQHSYIVSNTHLLVYYLFGSQDELLPAEELSAIQQNVVELVMLSPHNFATRILCGAMWWKGWGNSLPVEERRHLLETYGIWLQIVDFVRLGLHLNELWDKGSNIWQHIVQRFRFK